MKDGRYLSVCKLCYTCPIFLSESQGVFQSGKTHGSWVHVRLWVHVGCSLTHIVTRNPARVTSARLIHKTTPRVTRTQIMAGSIRAQTCTPSSIQIPPPHAATVLTSGGFRLNRTLSEWNYAASSVCDLIPSSVTPIGIRTLFRYGHMP